MSVKVVAAAECHAAGARYDIQPARVVVLGGRGYSRYLALCEDYDAVPIVVVIGKDSGEAHGAGWQAAELLDINSRSPAIIMSVQPIRVV